MSGGAGKGAIDLGMFPFTVGADMAEPALPKWPQALSIIQEQQKGVRTLVSRLPAGDWDDPGKEDSHCCGEDVAGECK